MRHTSFATLSLTACLSAVAVACASNAPLRYAETKTSPYGDAVITGDEIDAQHSPDAWDLLKKVAPRYNYLVDRSGRAIAIARQRGKSSVSLGTSESAMVIVDGARLNSLEILQNMPTNAIDRIELLSSSHGTSVEGTGASAGVIHIHTRFGS